MRTKVSHAYPSTKPGALYLTTPFLGRYRAPGLVEGQVSETLTLTDTKSCCTKGEG
jgi:hypothetical protein